MKSAYPLLLALPAATVSAAPPPPPAVAELLEDNATPEARNCQAKFSKGGEDAWLRQAAGAALKRLDAAARK